MVKRLISGYKAFLKGGFIEQKALYEELGSQGQHPRVMLIACADSRVDPTDIFNAYPGEMFVSRNVANIVPPSEADMICFATAAALEYAVTVLNVHAIIVMGHESCGGIKGCIEGLGHDPKAGYVGHWVALLNGMRDRVLSKGVKADALQREMELEGVRESLRNLMTYDFVREAVEAGTLELVGAHFGIISAELYLIDDDGEFEKVPET